MKPELLILQITTMGYKGKIGHSSVGSQSLPNDCCHPRTFVRSVDRYYFAAREGLFIYPIAGEQVNTEHLKKNQWVKIDANLLPYIEAGLEEAVGRGYLTVLNPGDYAVTGMNMGWELPGTFDASIQIRDLGILTVLK